MPDSTVTDAPSRAVRALLLAALALATCAVLWPILHGQFVYDDLWLVAQNPSLQSVEQLTQALRGGYWDFVDSRSALHVGYWRPLTSIALFVGNRLGDGSPEGFHALSLVLHLVAVGLAFELARRLTRSTPVAFFVALWFALHPVQVEPVAWIASINDPLQGALSLATLLTYLRWRERGSPGLPLLSAFLLLCALLAKENALALLPLIVALDLGRVPAEGERAPVLSGLRPLLRPYTTFLVAFVVYYAARVAVFGDAWAGFDRESTHLGLTNAREWSLRVEILGGALGLLAWPAHLNLFRDTRPEILWSDRTLWTAAACIAVWAILVIWAWRKRARPLLAGLLLIVAALAPALVRVEALGRFALSERYLYVSVFGFALFVVLAVSQLVERPAMRRLAFGVLVLVAAAYAWRSRERTVAWQDERTLFAIAFEANPKSPYVAWSLGRVLMEDFRRTETPEFLVNAKAAFEHSLDLGLKREDGTRDPEVLVTDEDRLQANLGLGWSYFFGALRGYYEATLDEAYAIFEQTLRYFPESYEAMTGLGVVRMTQDQLELASAKFDEALKVNPKYLEAWYYRGKLELRRGKLAEAKDAFEHVLAMKPADVDTLPLYAGVLAELGQEAEARTALARSHELAPEDIATLMGLGLLSARQRDHPTAMRWFDRVLELQPDYAPARLQKGKLLLATGQVPRALAELQRACELNPSDFEAHYTLGVLLVSQGMAKESLPFLERALEVGPNHPLAEQLRAEIERIKRE